MESEIRFFIQKYIEIPEDQLDILLSKMTFLKLSRKSHFTSAGEYCTSVAFFNKGYFRFYYYSRDGNEVTLNFHFSPGFITSYTSFITGKPSQLYVQAMENMELLSISRTDLNELSDKYHNLEKFAKILADQVAIDAENHLLNILNSSAEERYEKLLKQHPEFIHNIPLQYIASYLGVSPETLSRIRRKIH